MALNSGADKTAINTAAVKNPNFIKEASKVFGSQCIVSSIDAKKNSNNFGRFIQITVESRQGLM